MMKNQQEIFKENNLGIKNKNYYDLSLSIQDISASTNYDYKHLMEKKICQQHQEKSNEVKMSLCFSPMSPVKENLFCSFKKHLPFSSTPLRNNTNIKSLSKTNEIQKNKKSISLKPDITEYAYIDADLFEDWNDCKPIEKNNWIEKNSSMLLKAEFFMEKDVEEKENKGHVFDNSIDLLTGELIKCEKNTTENFFVDSFNASNVDFFTKKNEEYIEQKKYDCFENKTICKNNNFFGFEKKNMSIADKKLNFESSDVNLSSKHKDEIIKFENDCSFDDFIKFDFTQSLKDNDLKLLIKNDYNKITSDSNTTNLDTITIKDNVKIAKNNTSINLNDSGCFNIKKKGKFNKIVESDNEDDDSSYFIKRQKIKNTIKKILPYGNSDAMFLDLEAEVSDGAEVSSDESIENLDEYEKSFLDEKSYFTQNKSKDITSKYLESIKCYNPHGAFKIPKLQPYIFDDIYSEIPSNTSLNYEFDSFCVNDIEFDEHLSDLEIAEQILEMGEKKKKKEKKKKNKEKKN